MQPNTHWSAHDTCAVKEGHNSYILGIAFIRDCTSKAGCMEAVNWLSIGQFYVWQCETIGWVLEGSYDKSFVCNCFMIHAEYTIEDSGVLSNKISQEIICVVFDLILLYFMWLAILFLILQNICRRDSVFNFSTLDRKSVV